MKMTKRVKKDQAPTENDNDDDQQQQQQAPSSNETSKKTTSSSQQQQQQSKITSDASLPAVIDHTITLREHMIKSLKQGDYECIICSNELKTAHPIWSCSTCYRCYHIGCAKKWANKSIETANGGAA